MNDHDNDHHKRPKRYTVRSLRPEPAEVLKSPLAEALKQVQEAMAAMNIQLSAETAEVAAAMRAIKRLDEQARREMP